MKSVLVLAVLLSLVFVFTEGFALESHQTKSLKACNEKKIEKLINKIIDDTYNLKSDALELYNDAYQQVLECVISSFTTLVSCVKGVLTDSVSEFENDVEHYISTVQALAEKVIVDIEQCA